MEVTDIRETSCSEETPPKITARLSLALLFIAITPHAFQKSFSSCPSQKALGGGRAEFESILYYAPVDFATPPGAGRAFLPGGAAPRLPRRKKG